MPRHSKNSFVLAVGALVLLTSFACTKTEQPGTATTVTAAPAAPARAKELTAERRTELANEVKQRTAELHQAWAQPNAFDAWMTFYVDDNHPSWADADVPLVVNTQKYGTRADIEKAFRQELSDRTTQVTMKDEAVSVLSEDHAIHHGNFTFTVTRNGKTEGPFAAVATTAWVREGGKWKILHYTQSWKSPGPERVKN